MWEQICISNRDAIGVLLDKYIDELEAVRSHIKNDSDDECSEYIKELFNTAGGYRNTFK
jgi:prephenate dehydrogenase